jgi:hypothetical protein
MLLSGCSKDEDPVDMIDCTGVTPTYTSDIKSILDASCAKSGCHDSITQADGKNFSTYATASAISLTNEFLGAVQHRQGFMPMPKDGPKLSDDKIQLLTCWVQNGSPN